MRKVRVLSIKYDGSLRDEYETYLYADTEDAITLFTPPGLRYWDYRKEAWFQTEDGLIEIYFKQRWYNVWHICEQVSRVNHSYVNIAMPVTLGPDGIQWTDLDLDYRVHLDHSVEQLDQADYAHNAQRMGYPPELMAQVEAACREVEVGLARGSYPFDHAQQIELYRRIKADLGRD